MQLGVVGRVQWGQKRFKFGFKTFQKLFSKSSVVMHQKLKVNCIWFCLWLVLGCLTLWLLVKWPSAMDCLNNQNIKRQSTRQRQNNGQTLSQLFLKYGFNNNMTPLLILWKENPKNIRWKARKSGNFPRALGFSSLIVLISF